MRLEVGTKRYEDLPLGAQQLHDELWTFVTKSCRCQYPTWTLGSGAPPTVRCLNCDREVGYTSWSWWEDLRMNTELAALYSEVTYRYKHLQQPHWEVFILNQQKTKTVDVDPGSDLDLMLKVMPGHIVWATPEEKVDGEFCTHRFILMEEAEEDAPPIPRARCLLCRGVRELTEGELHVIESAEQAGVVFLKWQDRFEELSSLKSRGRKGRRRTARGPRVSKATGGITAGAAVPEGYIPVAQAAKKLGLEPKKLRRLLRAGRFPATKVGGKVYCKIE